MKFGLKRFRDKRDIETKIDELSKRLSDKDIYLPENKAAFLSLLDEINQYPEMLLNPAVFTLLNSRLETITDSEIRDKLFKMLQPIEAHFKDIAQEVPVDEYINILRSLGIVDNNDEQ